MYPAQMKKLLTILLALLTCSSAAFAQSKPSYAITNKIQVSGDGSWDYLTMDAPSHRLFVSHSTMVQVLDVTTRTVVGTIPANGVHGIALAPALNKGFISNGRDSSVTVFNLKTLEVLTVIRGTGVNPDAILYEPVSKRVFTFNGRSKDATVIDATTLAIVATIPLGGKPEFSATDGKGTVFVNIEDKNQISVINAKTATVEKQWSLAPGTEPTGMAIDTVQHRLFSVCGNKMMVITDAQTGRVVTTVPIGEGTDGVAFDPGTRRAYSSNGEGTLTVVQEDKNSYSVLATVPTQKGARTIGIDATTHRVYLPAAEYLPPPQPTAENPRPRAPIKPGTFVILEIEQTK
jgi:YVTN family beta-propeller protein